LEITQNSWGLNSSSLFRLQAAVSASEKKNARMPLRQSAGCRDGIRHKVFYAACWPLLKFLCRAAYLPRLVHLPGHVGWRCLVHLRE